MSHELDTVSLEQSISEATQHTRMPAPVRGKSHVPPIFVVGVWRSGTTLLYSLLNQHPDIRLFYESDLPALWPMFRVPWGRKNWFEKWEYWNAGVSRHDLDPVQLEAPVKSLAEAAELAGRQYAAQQGKTRWGCKSPSYYDRMVSLAGEFPDARFIVIWRDPEEICRSVIRASATALWFTRPGMTHKALLASKVLKNQCQKVLRMGAAVHQIHYEDLVNHPSDTMKGVCEFLQVPFTPAVAVLSKGERSEVFAGAHHNLAKGGQIIAKKGRNEPLPPALAEKVDKYKARWLAEGDKDWLLTQHFSEARAGKLGLWERMLDQIQFMLLRLWDIAPRIAFSILPLSAWQTYRRLKYKDAEWVHRQITTKETTLRKH
jgi:hypothetical protein